MKRTMAIALSGAAVAALAAGCSSATTSSTTGPPSSHAGSSTVKTASTGMGTVLVDGSGRTLYLFKADTGSTSTCNGACAQTWPPDTTNGKPTAGSGVGSSLLGTTMRSDHKTQITYKGHPLYYYSGDSGSGATNGQGINSFGGLWYVVSPSGAAITSTSGSGSSPSGGGSSGGSGGYGY